MPRTVTFENPPMGTRERFLCVNCEADTYATGEYYALEPQLWARCGLGPHEGMLCLRCFEASSGHMLIASDFVMQPESEAWSRHIKRRPFHESTNARV